MKIVYCIPMLYNSGGMERVLTQKVNWLSEHTKHEFTIITTECTPEGMREVYYPLNKKVRVVPFSLDFNADYSEPLFAKWMGHTRRMRMYEKRLRAFIQAERIDLCISMGGKEVAFLRRLPCRTIVEMHFSKDQRAQLLMANHRGFFWSLVGRIRTGQLIRDVRGLERIVVLTESDKADWEKAGCRNVSVIPNPCALDQLQITNDEIRRTKTVLAVGRLHEQKGFDRLIEAWSGMEQRFPEWRLRIIGEGPKRVELETQIRDLGLQQVCLAGRTGNIAEEYFGASLFVMSSRYEGLPLAMIEAMWCGVPCISFDCPQGPKELLAEERGWLVPEGDVEKLRNQIEYAISHPEECTKRAIQAKTYAQQTYSEAAIMPQWEKVMNKD